MTRPAALGPDQGDLPEPARGTYHHGDLRSALIGAAEEILAQKGAEGLTLRECARRVGVSASAPAHHFGNMTGLLAAIATLGFDDLSAAMERQAAASDGTPAGRLRAMAQAYVDFARQRPGRFRVTFGSALSLSKTKEPALQAAAARAFGILRSEIGGGPASETDGLARTVLAWSSVHGLATLLLDGRLDFLAEGGDGSARVDPLISAALREFERFAAP